MGELREADHHPIRHSIDTNHPSASSSSSSSRSSSCSPPPFRVLFFFAFCCGACSALASVFAKLLFDFHSQEDNEAIQQSLSSSSASSSFLLSPSSSGSCISSREEDFTYPRTSSSSAFSSHTQRSREENDEEEEVGGDSSPSCGNKNKTFFSQDILNETDRDRRRSSSHLPLSSRGSCVLPSSLLSFLQLLSHSCVSSFSFSSFSLSSFFGESTLHLPLLSHKESEEREDVKQEKKNPSISSLCSCKGYFILLFLRLFFLLLMIVSNTVMLHYHFQSLLKSSSSFIPSVLIFSINFLLCGLLSCLIFQEHLSSRWILGALSMLVGVLFLMREEKKTNAAHSHHVSSLS